MSDRELLHDASACATGRLGDDRVILPTRLVVPPSAECFSCKERSRTNREISTLELDSAKPGSELLQLSPSDLICLSLPSANAGSQTPYNRSTGERCESGDAILEKR